VKASSPRPADFDKFWDDAVAKLDREVPLDPQVVRVDAKLNAAMLRWACGL
jgi:cephalosporin-C deacetylase-like acetyl esterase